MVVTTTGLVFTVYFNFVFRHDKGVWNWFSVFGGNWIMCKVGENYLNAFWYSLYRGKFPMVAYLQNIRIIDSSWFFQILPINFYSVVEIKTIKEAWHMLSQTNFKVELSYHNNFWCFFLTVDCFWYFSFIIKEQRKVQSYWGNI